MRLHVLDNLIPEPAEYLANALRLPFKTYDLGTAVFHGIALDHSYALPNLIEARFPGFKSTLSFFRQSPLGQLEPNFIHTDDDMGEWTGILYLNPTPAAGDGTVFWRHRETGLSQASTELDWQLDGHNPAKWERVCHVDAAFNRLLMFPAPLFHSRAIAENYGNGEDARLIQVVFGTGRLGD